MQQSSWPSGVTQTGGCTARRRRWLAQAGCQLGFWPWWLQSSGQAGGDEGSRQPIKACIFVFYYGGPSHLDTYDLKPHAPAEIRGEFQPISTSAPGLQISEHLPRMSQWMHKVALVRSMHHTNRLHDSASTETFTGRQGPQGDREEFAPIPQFFPSHGGVISQAFQGQGLDVAHAILPRTFHNVIDVPCQGAGFLGRQFDPFQVLGDPNKLDFQCPSLQLPSDLPRQRISRRRDLVNGLERSSVSVTTPGLDQLYARAYDLLGSDKVRQALQIHAEPVALRERYGMAGEPSLPGDAAAASEGWRTLRGQNLLMARRLVEAGVPFVVVNDFYQQGRNWDSHADNFKQNRRYLLPQADQALSALLEDLSNRGLLDSTLVVATGEFGRTPLINASAGRDHWPDCYSLLLAGGGIRGGAVYGSSDSTGAFPATDPTTPADLAATIYWRFGLDPRHEITDRTGRPWRLSDGQPWKELFEG